MNTFDTGDTQNANDGLGSLAQAARTKQLNSARSILLFIGIITVLANGVFFFMAKSFVDEQFDSELAVLRSQGMEIDNEKVEELRADAIQSAKLINGVGLAIGVAFIILGLNVKKNPVPMTITGLVLYLGSAAVFGLMDPASLAKGLIIKIFIIVGLFKAVQSAVAYEKEAKNEDTVPLAELAE